MSKPIICVVGSLSYDIKVRVRRFPRPAETIAGEDPSMTPAGKGTVQAVAAARAGAEVALIGRVGRDDHGRAIRAILRREGVDDLGVAESWSEKTGISFVTVSAEGEATIVSVPGANAGLGPGEIEEAHSRIEPAAALVLSLQVPLPAVASAAKIAIDSGARVILNAAPARPFPDELRGLIDVVVVNTYEAEQLTGAPHGSTPEQILKAAQPLGLPAFVLTRGGAGTDVLTPEGHTHIDAFPVEPIDTSGAGDVGIGVLAAEWALRSDARPLAFAELPNALRASMAAGSIATTRVGVLEAAPQHAEIRAMLDD